MENVAIGSGFLAPRRLGRSIGAVVAGLLAIVVTHTAADAVLHTVGVFPPAGQSMSGSLFALALSYRLFFSVLGAALTAYLAPARPLKHSLVLGCLGLLGSFGGLVATLGHPELGPMWYPLALLFTSLPCCWLGARLASSLR